MCEIALPPTSFANRSRAPGAKTALAPPSRQPATPPADAPYRILVVEDSSLILMSIEMIIEDMGWKVVGPASTLQDAMAIAGTEEIDAALLDVNLHGELTWDVAVLLRQRGVPFAFSTGYDTSKMLPPHLSGSLVISKPFHIPDVERHLRGLVSRPAKTD